MICLVNLIENASNHKSKINRKWTTHGGQDIASWQVVAWVCAIPVLLLLMVNAYKKDKTSHIGIAFKNESGKHNTVAFTYSVTWWQGKVEQKR